MEEANSVLHQLLLIAEKSFSVFVACYVMMRLENKMNRLCDSVLHLIGTIEGGKKK